ncbi:hypothetical protein [Lysobacter sp. FW306-1B-D06B]|uniref:hypothetical protein n=1 Tax=Lysobacter sp. FW306-1B-D06B TaxID=3140250 RepID=UPI0031401C64
MNPEAEWIEVDEDRYDKDYEERRDVRSVVIHVSASPYDIPHQVKGEFAPDSHRLVITFRYLADEPTHQVHLAKHAIAAVGKKSGRVYSIEIDVDSLNVEEVKLKLQIDDAISNLAEIKHKRERNYDLARKVVGDYWSSISQMLAKDQPKLHAAI